MWNSWILACCGEEMQTSFKHSSSSLRLQVPVEVREHLAAETELDIAERPHRCRPPATQPAVVSRVGARALELPKGALLGRQGRQPGAEPNEGPTNPGCTSRLQPECEKA